MKCLTLHSWQTRGLTLRSTSSIRARAAQFDVKFQMSHCPTSENIVKTGTFLYDEIVLCDVCIVLSPVRFGTGDYEDPPEDRDDVEIDTYYVWFGSTTARGHYNVSGGGWPSLAEAVANVESQPGFGKSVLWFNSHREI